MNSVNAIGRLTSNPDFKLLDGGNLCSFTLAIDNGKRNTVFINCTTFGDRADLMAKTLRKGSLISISGRLDQRSYETQNGDKRVAIYIVVESFDYLEKKKEEEKPQQKASFTADELFDELPSTDDDLPF